MKNEYYLGSVTVAVLLFAMLAMKVIGELYNYVSSSN